MRLLLGLIALMALAGCGGEADHNVLFIGNSHTWYNDMPDMVEEIADANGVSIDTHMIAPNGTYLHEHAENDEVVETINSGTYDIIIFQEQSVAPAIPQFASVNTYPAAQQLDHLADRAGAQVIWYQTWGWKNGFPDQGFPTYESMQNAVSASYERIASDNGGKIARAGDAFAAVKASGSDLELYNADGSHASETGSYVAALEITEAIVGPLAEAPSIGDVDGDTAEFLLGL